MSNQYNFHLMGYDFRYGICHGFVMQVKGKLKITKEIALKNMTQHQKHPS